METKTDKQCWQYTIRLNNLCEDLCLANLSTDAVANIKVADFKLQFENKESFSEIKQFISRHEWLGTVSLYPTHIFTARYNGYLAGVVIFDMPPAFSKLLGNETKSMERLISRGACVSWSPKNLASRLISFAMKWMVKNTNYRIFTAYSDSSAGELGTIYQACNFYYIGKKSGAGFQYKIETGKWVSDRYFRARSVYKRLAKMYGIEWKPQFQSGDSVLFKNMPEHIAAQIKNLSRAYQDSCERRKIEPKHKYVYVLGRTKKETRQLRKIFEQLNRVQPYPTTR